MVQRELIFRRFPHGLMGLAYLWPGRNEQIRLHRILWWWSGRGWRRPFWLVLEIFLWLRWLLFHALPASLKAILRFGPDVRERYGISYINQASFALKSSIGWCLHPIEIYRYRLYLCPEKALEYVFDSEISAFHAWRSRKRMRTNASLRLIQDKTALAEYLQERGIPAVISLVKVPRMRNPSALSSYLGEGQKVFCKMNSGNQGRKAFVAWKKASGLVGRNFSGETLVDSLAVEAAWKLLCAADAALIQNCLENHPMFAEWGYEREVVTIRFISQWNSDVAQEDSGVSGFECLCAYLEIPVGVVGQEKRAYVFMPIDVFSGQIAEPIDFGRCPKELTVAFQDLLEWSRNARMVPNWSELVNFSFQAHRYFPDVQSIAWDWVVTPTGPVLLEGNTGWAGFIPQFLDAGFFSRLRCI